MASIMQYTTEAGKKRYKVQVFLGLNEHGRKRYKVKGGYSSKVEANQAAKELEKQVLVGELTVKTVASAPTFRNVYDEWIKAYKLTVKESSFSKTLDCFRLHILPAFEDLAMDQITVKTIQDAVTQWFEASPTNFKRYYVHANRIMRYALDNGLIAKNPAEKVILPKKQEHAGNVVQFWDKEQLTEFFSCIDWHKDLNKYVLFRVLAYSGLRIGEAMALTWEDVDFTNQTIDVNKTRAQGLHGRTLINPPKTKASRRTVPIDEDTVNWLRQWRDIEPVYLNVPMKRTNQLIWSTTNNQPLRMHHPARWLETIIKKNNLIPISLHKFRHGYISNLLLAGVPVSTVMKLVGHTDSRITLSIYAHVHTDDEQKAADKLAEYLRVKDK